MTTTNGRASSRSFESMNPEFQKILHKLSKYNKQNFITISLSQLRPVIAAQTQVISSKSFSKLKGQQLLIVVLNNHVKALIDLGGLSVISPERQKFEQDNQIHVQANLAKLQQLQEELNRKDQELNRIIVVNKDFKEAKGIIQKAIEQCTMRSFKERNNNLIQARVKTLRILLILTQAAIAQQKQKTTQTQKIGSQTHMPSLWKGTSYKELEASHVRLIIQQLDQKVEELSTICEQIPQLQTYMRTLDLTMPEHNAYLAKIVQVLIELHHKVNKLLSRRPQKLLKQIQQVQRQCELISNVTQDFLMKLQSEQQQQQQVRLKAVYFDQKKNKSPQYFQRIQKNIVNLSQHIIYCINLQAKNLQRIGQIRQITQIFWNVISGVEDYQREWQRMKSEQKCAEEAQIIQILDQCLRIISQNKAELQYMKQEYDRAVEKFQRENLGNVSYLEQEISKLSRANQDLNALLQELEADRYNCRTECQHFKQKYYLLQKMKNQETMDIHSRVSMAQKRQKAYKDRIEALESENEQKKIMIANVTNDLKRAMRQSESVWKMEQKNKQLTQKMDKLMSERQKWQEKQDEQLSQKKELNRLQNNNVLLLTKFQDAKQRLEQSQNYLIQEKIRAGHECNKLEEQLQICRQKIQNLEESLNQKRDTVTDYNKQISYQQNINSKDKKITEYNNTIISLSTKIKDLTNNIKQREQMLRRKEEHENELVQQIRDLRNSYDLNIKQRQQQYLSKVKNIEDRYRREANIQENKIRQLDKFLKNVESKQKQGDKIKDLEVEVNEHINEKNTIISRYETRIKELEDKLWDLNSVIASLNMYKKDADILAHQKTQIFQKLKQSAKEIEYLKQKVRSLEDLIDIFTEEQHILQAKIKQYRLKQAGLAQASVKIAQLNQDICNMRTQLVEKEGERNNLAHKKQQSLRTSLHISSIGRKDDISEQKMKIQAKELEKIRYDFKTLQEKLCVFQNKHNEEQRIWFERERQYIAKINKLQEQANRIAQNQGPHLLGVDKDKFYLRVEGERLEQIIKQMQSSTYTLNQKADQIIFNSRRLTTTSQISQNGDFKTIIDQNMQLINQVKSLINEKEQLGGVLKAYPNPNFLTEFVFKIIVFFSELHPDSVQAIAIWDQLQNIRTQYAGGQYFIVLEQFTKYSLEQNAIQVYRRKLKEKAQQLEILRAKLDSFYEQQIRDEEKVYSQSMLSSSRTKLFRKKYKFEHCGMTTP